MSFSPVDLLFAVIRLPEALIIEIVSMGFPFPMNMRNDFSFMDVMSTGRLFFTIFPVVHRASPVPCPVVDTLSVRR